MKISKRLKTLGEMIDSKDIILDVGCDHALLDVFCIMERNCRKAYASDNKNGPLEKANENIEFYKLEDKIETILSDGISIIPEDVDSVVISGMGGRTIETILVSNKDNLKNINKLYLSPNNDYIRTRSTILKLGYHITSEKIVEDKNHFYLLLKCEKGRTFYTKNELEYGPLLLKENSKEYIEYLKKELQQKNIILSLTPKNYVLKRFILKKKIKLNKKLINKSQ